MKLFFLQASTPLTKTYAKQKDGSILKTPYPSVSSFSSIEESCATLAQLETLLKKHAAAGHCLLKGQLARPLKAESRAGSTDRNDSTEFLVLDIDGLSNVADADTFMAAIGLAGFSYVLQHSASANITDKTLRAHIFIQLSRPAPAALIKQWLIEKNLTTPQLTSEISLTKTGTGLHWPLDITACQNDKLIYIAPPKLIGLKDPFANKPRISSVKRTRSTFDIIAAPIASTEANKRASQQLLDDLRAKAGLPARKWTTKFHGNIEILSKPDQPTVTGIKEERDFVYFNFNGGDSWAYYHPTNNPDLIHNFKGEPAYLTKELLPEYWAELTQRGSLNNQGTTYLMFCDRNTSTYWRGTYDQNTDTLDLYPAKNVSQVRDFSKQYGVPLGDFVPEWDMHFDPSDNVRVDPANKTINLFQPSPYMQAVAKRTAQIPKTIHKVIHHALGGDKDVTEHFINWLAYILQKRDRTRTAWVLHGTQGTGKGVLMNNILRPLFGPQQTTMRRMEEFDQHYNGFMRHSMIVFVDEVQIKKLRNEGGVMAKLKNFITEAVVPIREMYQSAVDARNYSNWIFASNMPDPVSIDKADRRFNVGRYQPDKLQITGKEIDHIPKELQQFHDYLLYYKVDEDKASTPIETEDRNTLIALSTSSVDEAADAILQGDMTYFIHSLPPPGTIPDNMVEQGNVERFTQTLVRLIDRTNPATGQCHIHRDELQVLFNYAVGGNIPTRNKFTSLLKHHRVHLKEVWIDNKTVRGMTVEWKNRAELQKYRAILSPDKAKPKLKSVK